MRTYLLVLAAALPIIALDRFTKYWVVEVMDLQNRFRIIVWDGYFDLVMAWNRGVNFGLLDLGADGRWVLIVLSLAITGALLWWVRGQGGWMIPIGTGLIVGGALGNVWDRLAYGAVADFINVTCCGVRNPFAFNVADIAIFAGAAALIVWTGRSPAPPAPRRKSAPRRSRRDAAPKLD